VVDWRRVAIGVGAAAAGTVTGYLGERALVRTRLPVEPGDPLLGQLSGRTTELDGPGGVRLVVETYGPVEPSAPSDVVLVHGFCLTARSWHEQVDGLSDRLRLVTYDQPGHGRSSTPEDGFTWDLLGDCLARVVEQATDAGRPLVLAGHSMGGMAILTFARRHPELFESRVTGLVLLSTASKLGGGNVAITHALRAISRARAAAERVPRLGPRIERLSTPTDLSFAVARSVGFVRAEDARYVRFVEEQVLQTPLETIIALSPVILAVDEEVVLESLDVPTWIVVGEDDRLTPVAHARRMTEINPDVELVELPGVGHVTQLTGAETVNRLLLDLALSEAPEREAG
jgi:pimeloyl-ACP methyl ester carboxylesterase